MSRFQESLDQLWREGRSALVSVHESKSKKLGPKASKRFKELEARASMLRRAQAGWAALNAWCHLTESEMGEASADAMVDAGFGLISDPKVKAWAFGSLAEMAIRMDNPKAWQVLVTRGFDPVAVQEHLGESRKWFTLNRWDSNFGEQSEPINWLARAMAVRSWGVAELLAPQKISKIGCPGFETPHPELDVQERHVRSLMLRSGDWDAREDDDEPSKALSGKTKLDLGPDLHVSRVMNEEQRMLVSWWRSRHPMLIAWDARQDEGGKACPKSLLKALDVAGLGAQWEHPDFRRAAAEMAFDSWDGIINECMVHKIDPELGLEGWTDSVPDIVKMGGLGMGDATEKKRWAKLCTWMGQWSQTMASELLQRAAWDALLDGAKADWNNWNLAEDLTLCVNAVRELARQGPLADADLNSQLAQCQDWSLELAQKGTSVNVEKIKPLRVALDDMMRIWDIEIVKRTGGETKPGKRIFKV